MYLSRAGKKWISVDARKWSIFPPKMVAYIHIHTLLKHLFRNCNIHCSLTPNYPSTVNSEKEDFLVVHPTKSQSHHNPFYSMGMDLQTGTSANMVN